MYERLIVKSDKGKECSINVLSFQIRIIDDETYLKCELERGVILIPFDNVVEITYNKSNNKAIERRKNYGEKRSSKQENQCYHSKSDVCGQAERRSY